MTQYNERFRSPLGTEELSLERAQQLKREARLGKVTQEDLGALARELERKAQHQQRGELSGVQLMYVRIKEMLGLGSERDYNKMLSRLGVVNSELAVACENTMELMGEYRGRSLEMRNNMYSDREMFGLNTHIYTQKEQKLNQAREELSSLEKRAVLGNGCTTESLKLHKQALEIENDLHLLSSENDELAVRILTSNSMLEAHSQATSRLQEMHGQLQRQRAAFSLHYEFALAQKRMVRNVPGVRSVGEIYMKSAVLLQGLEEMQQRMNRDPFAKLPEPFAIAAPKIGMSGDGVRAYWMTVADDINRIGSDV
jgi:hypothetical protein